MSLLFVFLVAYITKNVAIQVQVSKGTLQGEEVKVNDGTVYVFKSIPYAEPPVDNLRFKKPVEIANSDSVIDTTVYTSTCPNGFDLLTPQNVSEDCLYFSVFANKNCLEKACPVVFFVHDAINEPLSTSDFDELNVAEKFAFDDIVFVRPKYRSSIYGFLDVSKPIDEAPFNVGLHDLKLALNFVYKEINAFGGDPTKITVFGSSYGADLALLLLNSPQIRHIPIYQAILFNGMPSVGGGHSQNATQNVLKMLKCEYDQDEVPLNSTESLDCLYDKSTDELERAVFQTQTSETYWGPRFDQDLIPANDHEQLRDLWQPIPLLLILYAPTSNTDHAPNLDAAESCEILLPYFGYYSNSTLNKCVEFYSSDNRKSYSDALYAYTVKMARMNNAKGSTSYIGIIGEKVDNPDKIKFFVENATEIETDNEAKIISKYNEKIRRFIKGLDGGKLKQ